MGKIDGLGKDLAFPEDFGGRHVLGRITAPKACSAQMLDVSDVSCVRGNESPTSVGQSLVSPDEDGTYG